MEFFLQFFNFRDFFFAILKNPGNFENPKIFRKSKFGSQTFFENLIRSHLGFKIPGIVIFSRAMGFLTRKQPTKGPDTSSKMPIWPRMPIGLTL